MNRRVTHAGHLGTECAQRGFTMVEALVALVVLSIGLLGIAALYLDSLRAGRTAIYRTQAVNLAADMADRIRANRVAGTAYTVALGAAGTAPTSCNTELLGCTPEQVAADDVFRWKQELQGGDDGSGNTILGALPEGDGSIAVTAGTPNVYVITVQWTETGQDTPASYSLRLET